jgi:hypothetical protein
MRSRTCRIIHIMKRRISTRLHNWIHGGVQAVAHRAGYDLVKRNFYSPLPEVDRLPSSLWNGSAATPGVDLNVDEAITFIRNELLPYLEEFQPSHKTNPVYGNFVVNNGSYEAVDAELLYAMVRHARPVHIVEFGSGASSHVIDAARRASTAAGYSIEHIIFDPYPFHASPLGPVAASAVYAERVEDLSVEKIISSLGAGDILFVDTTHTVKTGGDVFRIILEILPRLAPGVWVHVHDIFLPYEYPREWVINRRRAWAEQYLLQAFLAFNPAFKVVLPVYAVTRSYPDNIREMVPTFGSETQPGAFWMRKVA